MSEEVNKKLIDYLKINNPEVIKLEPIITQAYGDIIVFKCRHESQQYCISLNI